MSPLLAIKQLAPTSIERYSVLVPLEDGEATTVHVVRYPRELVAPRVVCFEEATPLLTWCKLNNKTEAMVGGFFLRASKQLLGDVWIDGQKQPAIPIAPPFAGQRSALCIEDGQLQIANRSTLPSVPSGDLLQAGPQLTRDGVSLINGSTDSEGLSATSSQFDSDISKGRFPRTAIGINERYIFSVVCDGYKDCTNGRSKDAGLSLRELAIAMIDMGVSDSLNLDGGGSSTQISDGMLRNKSRGDGHEYPQGREVWTAIVFDSLMG